MGQGLEMDEEIKRKIMGVRKDIEKERKKEDMEENDKERTKKRDGR